MKYLVVVLTLALVCALSVESKEADFEFSLTTLKPEVDKKPEALETKEEAKETKKAGESLKKDGVREARLVVAKRPVVVAPRPVVVVPAPQPAYYG